MAFREMRGKKDPKIESFNYPFTIVFTEELRSLGYPQSVSMESFRTPNFDQMAKILYWLIKSYEPHFPAPTDFTTETNRVQFVKSVAAFLAPKAQINLNTRNLYKSDGHSVKELLKISSLLCQAKKAPNSGDSTLGAAALELNSKLAKLKQCRSLASEITEKGAEIYELLGQEIETKDIRTRVISQPFELDDIEKSVKSSVENLKKQLKETLSAFENLQADESNLVSKIEKKKQEFERAEKRLKSLQGVRPAYMDEYERIEKDLVGIYGNYMEKFRNLAYLEQQLDDYNREEQDKFVETEESLKRMQNRLREEELNLLRGEKEASSNTLRPTRPTAASSRGRPSYQGQGEGIDMSDEEDDENGISLDSDEDSSDDLEDEDSSELIQEGIPSKVGARPDRGQKRAQMINDDDDDSLDIEDDDDEEDDEENDF